MLLYDCLDNVCFPMKSERNWTLFNEGTQHVSIYINIDFHFLQSVLPYKYSFSQLDYVIKLHICSILRTNLSY